MSAFNQIKVRVKTRLKHLAQGTKAWAWLCWAIILVCGLGDWLWLQWFFRRQKLRHHARTSRTGSRDPGPSRSRPRLGFVITWYGRDVVGGAEAEAYGLIHALRRYAPDLEVEVLTTTLKEFAADWNQPVHEEGAHQEQGVTVRRFHPLRPGRTVFHFLNGTRLMTGGIEALWDHHAKRRKSPVPALAEAYYLRRMVVSTALLQYMEDHYDDYDAFVLIPYMFASTALGSAVAGPKGLVIPCLHDERYAYMDLYEQAFAQVAGMLCHVRSEAALVRKLYPKAPDPVLIGEQVDVTVARGDAARFRSKYGITGPFVLYAGRQIAGKNLPMLVRYMETFRQLHPEWAHVELVLIGKGDLDYSQTPGVRSLGFVPLEDKVDAYAAATCLGMLSVNESFSIVLMEAWLQETPAIVASDCAVTYDHVMDSGGGFAIKSAEIFASSLLVYLTQEEQRQAMGQKGRAYVLAHYAPEQVIRRFRHEIDKIYAGARTGPMDHGVKQPPDRYPAASAPGGSAAASPDQP